MATPSYVVGSIVLVYHYYIDCYPTTSQQQYDQLPYGIADEKRCARLLRYEPSKQTHRNFETQESRDYQR